jgi:hypothetical protein
MPMAFFNFYDGMCLAGSVFIGLRSVIIALPRLRREPRNYFLSNCKFFFGIEFSKGTGRLQDMASVECEVDYERSLMGFEGRGI